MDESDPIRHLSGTTAVAEATPDGSDAIGAAAVADPEPDTVEPGRPAASVSSRRRSVVLLLCILAVLGFYIRCGWSYGKDLDPALNRGDFANLQTDAFLAGQLNLKLETPDGLLLLDDPFDPVANAPYRLAGLHDVSMYEGKLYSYFGPAPVLLLFLPFQLLRVGDLSPTLACLIFCSGGFLASVGVFRILTRRFLRPLTISAEAIAVLALGFAAPMGWLISVGRGYEAAIACGYFMVFGGLYFLCRGLFCTPVHRALNLALGSFLVAGAVGARPSLIWALGFVGYALAYLWFRRDEARTSPAVWVALLAPCVVVGVGLAWYNWARFGSVTEFGTSYQLLGENIRRARADELEFLARGLFEYVLSPARALDHFPWLALRPLSAPIPTEVNYLREPVAGLLPSMPACVLGLVVFCTQSPRRIRRHWWLAVLIVVLVVVGVIVISTASFHIHGATMRYQLDYAPLLLLASTLSWFMFSQGLRVGTATYWFLHAVAVGVVVWSALFSIAITAHPLCVSTGSCSP